MNIVYEYRLGTGVDIAGSVMKIIHEQEYYCRSFWCLRVKIIEEMQSFQKSTPVRENGTEIFYDAGAPYHGTRNDCVHFLLGIQRPVNSPDIT